MAVTDTAAFSHSLKTLYPPARREQIAYRDNPLFAMLPKDTNAPGENIKVPVRYSSGQGRSSVISTAITNKSASSGIAFLLDTVEDHQVIGVSHKVVKQSEKNIGAFISVMEADFEGGMLNLVRSIATGLYRSGSGSIGQISAGSNVATDTITLEVPSDITNFEKGMVLTADDADGGGAVKAGTVTIESLDRGDGTITVTAASWDDAAGIATVAASDYLFVQGDYDQKVTGLAGWLPVTDPSPGEDFFGADRSPDRTRLAGVVTDGTGLPVEEAFIKGLKKTVREGGDPDYIFCNFDQWAALELSLGSKVSYVNPNAGGSATIGFKGIVLSGPKRPVTVLADVNCPNTRAYCLQMNTWKLYSMGAVPSVMDDDSLEWTRATTSNDLELRMYYYAQLGCNAPGFNGVIQLDEASI